LESLLRKASSYKNRKSPFMIFPTFRASN
jgi:hypothetical protein